MNRQPADHARNMAALDLSDPKGIPLELKSNQTRRPVVDDAAVLIRVRAAPPNPYDWHQTEGLPYRPGVTTSERRLARRSPR